MNQDLQEEEEKTEILEEPQLKTRPEVLLAMLQYEMDDIAKLEKFYSVVCTPILMYVNKNAELHVFDPEIWLILSFIKNVIDERRLFVTGEGGLSSNCTSAEDLQGPIGKWPDSVPKLLHSILLYFHHYYLYRESFLKLCERLPEFSHLIEKKEDEFGMKLLKTIQCIIQYPQNILQWVNQIYEKTEKKEKVSQDEIKLTKYINYIKAMIQRCQAATTDGIPDEITSQSINFKLSLTNKPSTYGRIVNIDFPTADAAKAGASPAPAPGPPPPAAGSANANDNSSKRMKGKVISKISPHNQENFGQIRAEIEANKRLHHMNILKMGKYLEDELFHYLVFPDTENCELADVMVKNKVLCEEAARPIFRELMHGVQHMHSNGVIHGQLSPNTVVFYKNHVRISDFSLCHLASHGEAKATTRGPLIYMSPESSKLPFDGAANDIWSCGIILYEMLAGCNPFARGATASPSRSSPTVASGSAKSNGGTNGGSGTNSPVTLRPKGGGKLTIADKVKRGDVIYPKTFTSSVIFLLKGILNKVPHDRFTVEQILSHQWMLKVNEIPIKFTLEPHVQPTKKKPKAATTSV